MPTTRAYMNILFREGKPPSSREFASLDRMGEAEKRRKEAHKAAGHGTAEPVPPECDWRRLAMEQAKDGERGDG